MKMHEYKVVPYQTIFLSADPEAALNELGKEGWKLVAASDTEARLIFARKAEKKKDKDDDDEDDGKDEESGEKPDDKSGEKSEGDDGSGKSDD